MSALAHAVGAPATVNVVGIFELLLAFLMLPGIATLWGAALQVMALASFLATMGYPFSFPQDLGLIVVIGGLLCTQSLRLPVIVRRDQRRPWRFRVAFDQRPLRSRARDAGAVLVLRLDPLAEPGPLAERALAAVGAAAQRATRPSDVCARASQDAYCLVLPRIATPEAIELVVGRVRRQLSIASVTQLDGQPLEVMIGAAQWGGSVSLPEALRLAEARAAYPADAALARAA